MEAVKDLEVGVEEKKSSNDWFGKLAGGGRRCEGLCRTTWKMARWKWASGQVKCALTHSGGFAKTCKEGRLEEVDLPIFSKKTLAKFWKRASEDHQAGNGFMKKASC